MLNYITILLGLMIFLLPNISHAENQNDPYRVLYYLDGYKCMIATTNINDRGNAPGPELYETPDKNAKIIGKAGLTSLINTRVPQINGRQAILASDGITGWVDVKYLFPLSRPCYAVLMANGRHGFGPKPPKQ